MGFGSIISAAGKNYSSSAEALRRNTHSFAQFTLGYLAKSSEAFHVEHQCFEQENSMLNRELLSTGEGVMFHSFRWGGLSLFH